MKIQLLLFDLAKRTKSGKYFCFFKKTLKWNRLEIELYQTQKLIEQVNHFYSNSNFFREKLNKNRVDVSSIKQLSDLKRIPPLTRAELQNCFDQMVCENSKSKARYSNSSGTTGLPVKYGKDLDGFSSGLAAGYLLWEMAGWKFSYRQLHIWGNPTSVKKWESPMSKFKSWVFRKQNIDSTLTNTPEGLMKVVKTILRFKPHSIDGYTSSIVNLAQFVKDKSINLPKVKIVISTAENLLRHTLS